MHLRISNALAGVARLLLATAVLLAPLAAQAQSPQAANEMGMPVSVPPAAEPGTIALIALSCAALAVVFYLSRRNRERHA